jgi:hypothetical protein
MRPRRDTITWRQIGTGYLMVLCVLLAVALVRWLPPAAPGDQTAKLAGGGVLVLGYLLFALARPLLRRAVARWPGAGMAQAHRAQRGAVAVLCLFSLGVTLFGAMVLRGYHG